MRHLSLKCDTFTTERSPNAQIIHIRDASVKPLSHGHILWYFLRLAFALSVIRVTPPLLMTFAETQWLRSKLCLANVFHWIRQTKCVASARVLLEWKETKNSRNKKAKLRRIWVIFIEVLLCVYLFYDNKNVIYHRATYLASSSHDHVAAAWVAYALTRGHHQIKFKWGNYRRSAFQKVTNISQKFTYLLH